MMNDVEEILFELRDDSNLINASLAEARVPDLPGVYSIFIDSPLSLQSPFREYQDRNGHRIIYIGIATKSLLKRLVDQDLRHKQASTFFRGMGTILGYRPPKGSLRDKKNKNNYRFSDDDTQTIIHWINNHLLLKYIICEPNQAEEVEEKAIFEIKPIVNTNHNPEKIRELAELRELCRKIAIE